MTPQKLLDVETATAVSRLHRDRTPEHCEKEVPGDVVAILVDAAVQVGALIDAVCCRVGDWVDLEHYHPHPGMPVGNLGDKATIVRLTLTENERSLRAGGYIEVRAMPKEKVVEADGGYYDAYRQPRPVIEGSLHWHELNPHRLGQVLMMMYGRIMRDYAAHAGFEENLEAQQEVIVAVKAQDRQRLAELAVRAPASVEMATGEMHSVPAEEHRTPVFDKE